MNNKNPLVSVVMSVFNDERYVGQAIESILSQSFDDFEFIIWNDGSIDNTEKIILSYKDPRIRYFYHENTGLGKALSLACAEAKGKYIARMDSDDIALNERLEKEVDFLERNPKYVLVSSGVYYIDENGGILGQSFPSTWNCILKHVRASAIVHPAVMFRLDVYKKTCGYLPIKASEDYILWNKLSKYGNFKNFIDPLIKYRILSSSLSHVSLDPFYKSIIQRLRIKIALDDNIRSIDIEVHNNLYTKAKKLSTNTIQYSKERYRTKYSDIIRFLSFFCGKRCAKSILLFFKNVISYLKLHL